MIPQNFKDILSNTENAGLPDTGSDFLYAVLRSFDNLCF
jgi:hypothetical protein